MIESFAFAIFEFSFAFFWLGIGLTPLYTKKPLMLPIATLAGGIVGAIAIFFLLVIIGHPLDRGGLLSATSWVQLAIYIAIIGGLALFVWNGFSAELKSKLSIAGAGIATFGIKQGDCLDALRQALQARYIAFQEQPDFFLLTNGNKIHFKLSFISSGIHLIYVTRAEDAPLIKEIEQGLQSIFDLGKTEIFASACMKQALIGLIAFIFGITKG